MFLLGCAIVTLQGRVVLICLLLWCHHPQASSIWSSVAIHCRTQEWSFYALGLVIKTVHWSIYSKHCSLYLNAFCMSRDIACWIDFVLFKLWWREETKCFHNDTYSVYNNYWTPQHFLSYFSVLFINLSHLSIPLQVQFLSYQWVSLLLVNIKAVKKDPQQVRYVVQWPQ